MHIILLLGAVVSTSANLDSFLSSNIHNKCTLDQFACTDGQCIPNRLRCDGNKNCNDDSDEKNCEEYLCKGPSWFKCKNNMCISKLLVCNGVYDCDDHSDEDTCETFKVSDHGKFICRENKTCFDIHKVCNNASGCPNRSDENSLCKKNETSCEQYVCEYDCILLSTGPRSICPIGHRLNEKKCKDINNCKQFDISRLHCSPPTLKLFTAGNNKYYHVQTAFEGNWLQALQFCNYNNMNLLSIETQEETDLLWIILYNYLHSSGNQKFRFWTSGTTQPNDAFVWIATGKPIVYTNWLNRQPDNAFTTEKCIEVHYAPSLNSVKWNDQNCTSLLNVICETSSLENAITKIDSNVTISNVF